ncbi:MAG: polysaccharide deacetylase family protein [Mycobacteriales bacterium]
MRTRTLVMVAGAGALAQIAPAASWLLPVRLAGWPQLAGIGRSGHLALTFDDGPDAASTPLFAAELARLGWTATFFLVAEAARAQPGVARELAAAGHELAVHGERHSYTFTAPPWSAAATLRRARETVEDLAGTEVRWYRPPFGVLTATALFGARMAGLQPVLWSAWGRDWEPSATPASVLAELGRGVLSGGTALLHDSDRESRPGSWRAALGALPLLAEETDMRHIEVGPLADHGLVRQRP